MQLVNKYFSSDDFERVDKLFKKQILDKNRLVADISGWSDTSSDLEGFFSKIQFEGKNINWYHSNNHPGLKRKFISILRLIEKWEDGRSLDLSNITYCQSSTLASQIILASLQSLGVNKIIFETPEYFATSLQSKKLGFKNIYIPTYSHNNYQFSISRKLIKNNSPCAVWITQPRASMGTDQDIKYIRSIIDMLGKNNFLVIDEAVEQKFPSLLSGLSGRLDSVIRFRNFYKPLGINGPRIAFIIHPKTISSTIREHTTMYGGAIDYFSLQLAYHHSQKHDVFRSLLNIANQQVLKIRAKVEQSLLGEKNWHVIPTSNGYLGAIRLNFGSKNHFFHRNKLIRFCVQQGVPILLGSHMGFAFENGEEHIRVNYYNRPFHILEGIEILKKYTN